MASTRTQALRNILDYDARRGLDYQGRPWAYLANTPTAITFARAGKAQAVDSNGLIYTPGYYDARYSKVVANDGNTYVGLLHELAATNLILYSQLFSDTAWTKTDTTVTSETNTAPDGSATAALLTEGSATTAKVVQAVTVTSGATVAFSRFLKYGNHDWVRFRAVSGSDSFSGWFNLSTGVKGSTAVSGGGALARIYIEPLGLASSWYRCVLVGSLTGITSYTFDSSSSSADAVTTRVAGGTRYEWGAQAEEQAVATSYIPTTTATVARVVETASVPFPDTIQALSGMVEFVEEGTSVTASALVFCIGATGGTDPYMQIVRAADGQYSVSLVNAAATASTATAPAGIVIGDRVRIWWELEMVTATTMRANVRQSVNGAAFGSEVNGTTIPKDATAFSDDLYSIGGRGSAAVGAGLHIRHVVALGSVSAETLALG